MIYVHKASVLHEGETLKINCEVDVNDERRTLFFIVDVAYETYITVDRADAFLVMLFYFAMRDGHDLVFESPLSEQLLYQVQTYLVDALHKANPSYRKINITCPYTEREGYGGSAVGTGMSCGVDSLFTLHAHQNMLVPEGYRVTHLSFFDVGAFQFDDGLVAKSRSGADLFSEQLQHAKACAGDAQLPLLVVYSNLGTCFAHKHVYVHTFRNCGTALLFQKLFGVYYYSSGYVLDQFLCSPNVSTGQYDLFSVPLLSTESTRFYSFSPSCARQEKTAAIQDDPLAQKHLLVCTHEGENCGLCHKCARVLIALDSLDALPKFAAVFDLDQYRKARTSQIGYAIASREKDYFSEIYPALKSKGKIPALSWLYAAAYWLLRPLEHWLTSLSPERKRKMVRLAKRWNIRVPW